MNGNWNSPIEQAISDWVETETAKGEVLEGAGAPIDLSDYFATPEHLRAGYALLKGAGFCPAEVELLRQIRELESRLESSRKASDDDLSRWREELTAALAKLGWERPIPS